MGEMQEIYANIEYEKPDYGKPQTIQTGPESSQKTCYRPITLFLGLLNVLLLAGIIILGLLHSARLSPAEPSAIEANLTERLQATDVQLSSLTEERDHLNVSLNNMRREMEKLQSLSKRSHFPVIIQSIYSKPVWESFLNPTGFLNTTARYNASSPLPSAHTTEKTCPAGWVMFQCSCYLFSTHKTKWDRSRQDCRNRDADLVVIDSFEEQEFLTNNLKDWSWIGLSDIENEGTWKWMDGTLLTHGYWLSGQPDNGGGHAVYGEEDCAHFRNDGPKEANWNDVKCDTSMLWICEK